MNPYIKIPSQKHEDLIMRVYRGHYATPHAHTNIYLDLSPLKYRMSEVKAAAKALSEAYYSTVPVDTIVCLEGTEVIGGFFSEELTRAGVISKNMHKTMYVLSPETDTSGRVIIRDNLQLWVKGKNVLLLMGIIQTGTTIRYAVDSLRYYGAELVGVSAVFSEASKIDGLPVTSLFTRAELPDYQYWKAEECPLCKAGQQVEAVCNGYGITPLK